MISNDVSIKRNEGGDFEIVPADLYQVQITDVTEREGTKFNSQDPQLQYMFKTVVVEGEQKGQGIVIFTTPSWFDGGKKSKPSKLFNLFKTVYAFYKKDVDVKNMEGVTGAMINDLIGKQLRVTVEITDAGKNKVTGFMTIKKEVGYTETNDDVEKALGIGKMPEDVDPEEVPV
jgi:hypothetical protein